VLAALLVFTPLGVHAEEEQQQTETPTDIGEIEVTAKPIELATRSLPGQPVIVVERGEWQPGARTVADVVEQLAPVSLQRTGGEGSLTTLSLRAAGAADTLVLLNGVPVTLPGGLPPDLSLFGLEQVERIEVLPGGSGTIHGSRALGGVVNIVTRSGGEGGASAALSAGSFGTVRVSLTRESQQPSSNEILTTSLFSTTGDFSFESLNGELRTRRNNRAQRVNAYWQRQTYSASELRTAFASLAALKRGVPGFAEFPTERAGLTEELLAVGVNSFLPASSNDWSRELSISGTQGFVRYTDDQPAMGGSQRSRAADASLHGSFALTRELPQATTEVAMQLSASYLRGSGYGSRHRISGGLSALRSLRHGRLTLTPSLGLHFAEGESLQPAWDFALAYDVNSALQLRASCGRSFRFPEFSELYYPAQGFITGNPALKPERAHHANLGATYGNGAVELSADVFWRRQHDLIRFLPVSAYSIKPLNTGETEADGLELAGKVKLSPHLRLSFAYALTDAEFTASGLGFPQVPRHRFSAGMNYTGNRWSASVTNFRESAQNADLFGSIRVPGKSLWNLHLAVAPRKGNTISLSVNNVFDQSARDYWDLPLPGRYVELTWEKRF
jgi:vitamin B12 transporter